MNIKSLLIGSAAALFAVSGARAADAVVAEPEAVEYVRVCDAYGAGFFYIPGTETCLKIGGYVRYQIDFSSEDNNTSELDGGWRKKAVADLQFTASSDTELGTLTSYIEVSTTVHSYSDNWGETYDNPAEPYSDGSFGVDAAWISLGGLTMGYTDTTFDGGINGEFDAFGGHYVHFMRYTFSGGNGFSATLALEEEDYNYDYMPNVVAKVAYSAGSVTATAWAAYDDDALGAGSDEFALKGIVSFKASDALTVQVGATYNSGANFYDNGYEWSLGASAMYQVNEKLALTAGGQYLADNLALVGADDFALGMVVDYTIVPNFTAKLAVNYKDGDSYGDGVVDGFLRFQRSF